VLACDRAAQAVTDPGGVEVEFSEGAAERIAVHTEFFGGFALVALVVR